MRAHAKTHHEVGRNGIGDTAELLAERMSEYKAKAKNILHKANNTSLSDVEKGVGSYIRENPGRSMLAAAATGLVIGFFLRRR